MTEKSYEEEFTATQGASGRALLQFNKLMTDQLSHAQEQNAWIGEATEKLADLEKKLSHEEKARHESEQREVTRLQAEERARYESEYRENLLQLKWRMWETNCSRKELRESAKTKLTQ